MEEKHMKIKDMSKEEIEMISYDDLAYMILNETNKKMIFPIEIISIVNV